MGDINRTPSAQEMVLLATTTRSRFPANRAVEFGSLAGGVEWLIGRNPYTGVGMLETPLERLREIVSWYAFRRQLVRR